MKKMIFLAVLLGLSGLCSAKEIYRRPSAGDAGAYYVLSSEVTENGIIKVLTSRIGKGNAYTDFTELKVNCQNRQFFELAGGSEDGAKEIPSKPLKDWSKRSKWSSLVKGSSKYDLVEFICRKYK